MSAGYKNKVKIMNKEVQTKLQNHRGRFTSILVNRAKSGTTAYCGRVIKLTDKTLAFYDVNSKRKVTVPLANVVG